MVEISLEALILIVGAGGALALRLLDLPDYLNKSASVALIHDYKRYLSGLTDYINARLAEEWHRINDLQDKVAQARDTARDKTQTEYLISLRWHLKRHKALLGSVRRVADRRTAVYDTLARLRYWRPSAYALYTVLYVALGAFFSWFAFRAEDSLVGLAQPEVAQTSALLIQSLVIGGAWPVYFRRKLRDARLEEDLKKMGVTQMNAFRQEVVTQVMAGTEPEAEWSGPASKSGGEGS